jgi:hypothetical protein
MGVFATRSPFRPNPIGLSVVKLEGIEMRKNVGPVLKVSGIDMMDNTPIYDIKPYLPHIDGIPNAKGGFAYEVKDYFLNVSFLNGCEVGLDDTVKNAIRAALAQDPRPSYQNDPKRIYGMEYCGFNVKFFVENKTVFVTEIEKIK